MTGGLSFMCLPSRENHDICVETRPILESQSVFVEGFDGAVVFDLDGPVDDQLASTRI